VVIGYTFYVLVCLDQEKSGNPDQNRKKYTKWPQTRPNGRKVDQTAIKHTDIFHYKSLQNLPKLGFLVLKYAIWRPWSMTDEYAPGRATVGQLSMTVQSWQARSTSSRPLTSAGSRLGLPRPGNSNLMDC
jgi:hypothetical protein